MTAVRLAQKVCNLYLTAKSRKIHQVCSGGAGKRHQQPVVANRCQWGFDLNWRRRPTFDNGGSVKSDINARSSALNNLRAPQVAGQHTEQAGGAVGDVPNCCMEKHSPSRDGPRVHFCPGIPTATLCRVERSPVRTHCRGAMLAVPALLWLSAVLAMTPPGSNALDGCNSPFNQWANFTIDRRRHV